jgi:uncharacterized protein YlxW (UPF0749 family)
MKWSVGNFSLLAGIGSLISAAIVLYAAWKAKLKADRQTESQVITVTAEAAESVVRMTNSQYDRLAARVDALEMEISDERAVTQRLMRRVLILEKYIRDNQLPVPVENGNGTNTH